MYKLIAVDRKGKILETRQSKTELTYSNLATAWRKAILGGKFTVKDIQFCHPGTMLILLLSDCRF